MATTHSTTAFAFEASEPGALSGNGFRCTCGDVQRTSLSEAEAQRMAASHIEWHAKAGR